MDYGSSLWTIDDVLNSSFGKRYVARTDISSCFPSIYSHAVPWAAVGFGLAKSQRGDKRKWFNKLDKAIRWTKRDETNGVAIGPATSTIVAETILARVDSVISKKFTYVRYIDDYTAYCSSLEESESFVLALTEELAKYKLTLNAGKTEIQDLPQSTRPDWVVSLRNSLPAKENVDSYIASDYLDFVIDLARKVPDGSVAKYGIKALLSRIPNLSSLTNLAVTQLVLRYTLNLSYHRTEVIPLLKPMLDVMSSLRIAAGFRSSLQYLLSEHVNARRTDAITWLLYLCISYGVAVSDSCAKKIVDSQDCLPMLLLFYSGNPVHQQLVVDFANNLDRTDLYTLDQYWLLLYQLYLEGRISDPYAQPKGKTTAFEIMKSQGANFIALP